MDINNLILNNLSHGGVILIAIAMIVKEVFTWVNNQSKKKNGVWIDFNRMGKEVTDIHRWLCLGVEDGTNVKLISVNFQNACETVQKTHKEQIDILENNNKILKENSDSLNSIERDLK